MNEYIDKSGYPNTEALDKIRTWDYNHAKQCFEFVKDLWSYPDYWKVTNFFDESKDKWIVQHDISTGGWSGNEDLVMALRENIVIWAVCWVSSSRGGKFVFEIED